MAEITVQNLNKSYGVTPILENVSFLLNAEDKVGLIGPNGCGKTTLMRILMGELEPDSGSVHCRSDLRIGYLKQNVHITSRNSIYEECKKAYARAFAIEEELRELEKQMGEAAEDSQRLSAIMDRYHVLTDRFQEEGGYSYDSEIRGILKGMGFEESRFQDPVDILSGGEKSRIELAAMLSGRPEVLFLDEPTNHLDAAAVEFLEGFLKNFRGTVLLISHDRYFLDRVVNRILLIQDRHLLNYPFGYREYTMRRAKDLEAQRHAYESQQEEIARQKEIIERLSHLGGSKRKRGISQSRSRQKLLDKMVLLEKPPEDSDHMVLRFTPKYPSGEDVLDVDHAGKTFEETELFRNVSFSIHRGQKVGLIGENGIGKTTLFRMILKKTETTEGLIRPGAAVKTAYFAQEQQTLNDEKTVLDELWDSYPQMNHFQVRSALARFQFTGDDIFRMVGELSGGEKSRLALLKLMLSSANFLLLDEPTNHLDIESREILEEALNHYDGTVLVISHDRYFLNHVCNRIIRLTSQGAELYQGNYDDYLQELEKRKTDVGASDAEKAEMTRTQLKKEQKQQYQSRKELRQKRAQMGELEKEIARLEAEERKMNEMAADPALYEDYEEARQLHDELYHIREKIEKKTDMWLALQYELEGDEE
ncbi:ribosomal protection-like ABC-F family protein [Peptoniphilaceae bacterium SGI.137]|nr:ABC-F family ATP-binding cassette domain-containing protein [Peptoniphilaceae bacterium]MDY3986482.1 ABC-F family ATP-binding cassette domain-containing protein [Peptoniphilaceae bacterium]